MNTSIHIHTNAETTIIGRRNHKTQFSRTFDTLDLGNGYTTASLFLDEPVAARIVAELAKLYPRLALPSGEAVDALAERYADEHAGDVGVDGPVEIEHVAGRASPAVPTEQAMMDYNCRVVDMVARAAGLIR